MTEGQEKLTLDRINRSAISTVAAISSRWQLSSRQVAGLVGMLEVHLLLRMSGYRNEPLSVDALERIAALGAIDKKLREGQPVIDPAQWVITPGALAIVGERTPLEAMIEGGAPVILSIRHALLNETDSYQPALAM